MKTLERLHVLHRAWRYRLRADRDELAFLMSCDLAGRTVLDIGANRGIYSYWMHKCVGPRGRVIAFEPQPELCVYLQKLRRTFGLDRMHVVNLALSSGDGTAVLNRPSYHWGGASLRAVADAQIDRIPVKTATLDTYCRREASVRPIAFIKCDVEGHEADVFQGARQTLANDRPDILFECFDHPDRRPALFAYLGELDYAGHFFYRHRLTPVGQLPQLRSAIDKPFLNYVFRPRERCQRAA